MPVTIGPDWRASMQDVLRAVGATLDQVAGRHVVVTEDGQGLCVRAHASATLADRLEGRWSPFELTLSAADLAGLRVGAVARRGTGHVAGWHERSLRMVGRHVDERGMRDVHLIEHGSQGGWLLWHRDAERESAVLVLLEHDELRLADATAAQTRAAVEALEASRAPSWGLSFGGLARGRGAA